jgi:hypothetical protein
MSEKTKLKFELYVIILEIELQKLVDSIDLDLDIMAGYIDYINYYKSLIEND